MLRKMLKNVPTYLGDKIECKVEKCDMAEWDNGGEKYDLILMINFLNDMKDENEIQCNFLSHMVETYLFPKLKFLFLANKFYS